MTHPVKYTREYLEQVVRDAYFQNGGKVGMRDISANISRVISRRYGWSQFLVSIDLRPSRGVKDIYSEQAIQMYKDGMTCQQIADKFGYTKHAVLEWLKDSDVEKRTAQDYAQSHPLGSANQNWKGGRYQVSSGYIKRNVPGRKPIMEHRLIAEQVLGRRLNSNEIVHHLNAIKNDNRPENLFIVTRQSHPLTAEDTYKRHYIARIRELEARVSELEKKLSDAHD